MGGQNQMGNMNQNGMMNGNMGMQNNNMNRGRQNNSMSGGGNSKGKGKNNAGNNNNSQMVPGFNGQSGVATPETQQKVITLLSQKGVDDRCVDYYRQNPEYHASILCELEDPTLPPGIGL